MIILSQRDPRWANIRLGTSSVTIGSHGCTITCLAMISDTTPDYVNKRLLEVGGYASGNLVIWSKVPQALPQLEFIKRSTTYNNEDVKNNLPTLVEVNGAKIGGSRHWVVFIGNQRMYDPWYGREESTSFYTPLYGYAIFKRVITSDPNEEKLKKVWAVRDESLDSNGKIIKIRGIVS